MRSPESRTSRAHHHGQKGHAVHLRLGDVDPGDVQDGGPEVDVGHQHLLGQFSDQTQQLGLRWDKSLPYLTGLVCFDVGTSDHERNPDVELVELPLVQRKRELTWRAKTKPLSGVSSTAEPDGCRRTCVVAVVRGEEDVRAVQFTSRLQPLHKLLHQVVH